MALYTEVSRPWGGTTSDSPGDAGPYTNDDWTDMWATWVGTDNTAQGVVRGYLSELAVSDLGGGAVQVDEGAAFVDGTWFKLKNGTSTRQFTIATPVAATRIDRIVLRKTTGTQVVRTAILTGNEGGGEPSLTQSAGIVWEIPLAKVSITTAGAITITDERSFLRTGLGPGYEIHQLTANDSTHPLNTWTNIDAFNPVHVSLTIGKWLVWGEICAFGGGGSTGTRRARIRDTTNSATISEAAYTPAANTDVMVLPLAPAIVTLTGAADLYLQYYTPDVGDEIDALASGALSSLVALQVV